MECQETTTLMVAYSFVWARPGHRWTPGASGKVQTVPSAVCRPKSLVTWISLERRGPLPLLLSVLHSGSAQFQFPDGGFLQTLQLGLGA